MALNLGENLFILILLTLLELLLIIVPAFISSKVEHKKFLREIEEMGFQGIFDNLFDSLKKVLFGVIIGFFLYLLNGLVLFATETIVLGIFGTEFMENAVNNIINTQPYNPSIFEIIIIILLQILVVGPCEEGFFRGFLIGKTHKKFGLLYPIIFSSILFTIYHIPPFLVPLSTIITFFGYFFITGLFLALTFIIFKNSVVPCSIAHSFFNILIILI